MRRRALVWAALAAAAAGCSDANLAEPEGLGLEAARYLYYALDIMQYNSIRRYEIDWAEFRAVTLEDAANAKTRADTHDPIRRALVRIGDNHSFFQPPPGASPAVAPSAAHPVAPSATDPTTDLLDTDIGYIDVPAFSGGGTDGDRLASLYHELIEPVDESGLCGWVVDLRGNTGGNMWPMLAGVGPILGEGLAGFFVDPDSIVTRWTYDDGVAFIEDTPFARADPYYVPADTLLPVAVLTDAETASSGEAIAVAFRGRPLARSFGVPTYGVSTANAGFGLADGAVIFLTIAWQADRTGRVYGGKLDPDEVVEGEKTGDRATDAVLDAALTWLEAMPCG